jgi:hypothetical protein
MQMANGKWQMANVLADSTDWGQALGNAVAG